MAKEEITPSEWQIMEVLWASDTPLTSSEVYKRMQENVDMSMRMVRVLMNRLNQKDVLGYTVDEHDSRGYHYYPVVLRPAYTLGGSGGGIAHNRMELEEILEKNKGRGTESPDNER